MSEFPRSFMNEVVEYCDSKYETLILTTEQPTYYQPFEFRVTPEYNSSVTLADVAPTSSSASGVADVSPGGGFRALSLAQEFDQAEGEICMLPRSARC